jgi:5-methylcytosine-specific restriction endonuclease McrA
MHKPFHPIHSVKNTCVGRQRASNGQLLPYVPIHKPPSSIPATRRHREAHLLIRLQNNRCYLCCLPLVYTSCHIDHVIPRSKGGSDAIANLRATCKRCNLQKSSLNIMDYALLSMGSTQKYIYRKILKGSSYRMVREPLAIPINAVISTM